MNYSFEIDQKEVLSKDVEGLSKSDLIRLEEGLIHILHNKEGHLIHLVELDMSTKTCTLELDGVRYSVILKDIVDQTVDNLGMSIEEAKAAGDIMAPMPGKVLSVNISAGENVEEGSPLIVLEAMKMENILKSPAEGVVKEVLIKEGDTVDKNQLLITIE